jgi:hypothetical protein
MGSLSSNPSTTKKKKVTNTHKEILLRYTKNKKSIDPWYNMDGP